MKFHKWWLHHDKLFSDIIFVSYNCICISLTQLTLFLFIERASYLHSTTCYLLIDMKYYGVTNILIVLILFWNWNNNTWKLCTTTQHTFPLNLMVDTQRFLPYPCQKLFETYAYHVTWKNFYMHQINDWKFHQISF